MLKSFGQNSIDVPKAFEKTIPPKAWSVEWDKLHSSKNEFKVSIIDKKLEVSKYKESKICEIKTPDGKFVGINFAEWAGKLLFVPAESENKVFTIKDGDIKFIFSYKDKLYFIEGISVMHNSPGALYEIDTSGAAISYKKILDFDDVPKAFTIYQNQIFVAGYKNFYIINNLKKEVIFENTFWSSLDPNSIVAFNYENVFVGIRGGIVKLNLNKKSIKFYSLKQV
ncbi:hypothetical protein HYN56_08745 [Flavobacterium crocinum]|uniref:Uncharacterized protein n=2 Tax=Flavobacterium crocinum TaxID=2183896 RepID=A0A2S1YJS2_9FLAO|nr:hypothetical protein HYN56_08745 [Flavobacterium crocinum]